jgi:REP element-mobilizing transposase RayT
MVLECWKRTEEVYPNIKLDYFCLLPNHLHGIIIIEKQGTSLEQIIHGFKSVTTRQFNKLVSPEEKNTLWQLSYYDEIIRNDEMLYDIRKYIQGNPSKWLEDTLYVQ